MYNQMPVLTINHASRMVAVLSFMSALLPLLIVHSRWFWQGAGGENNSAIAKIILDSSNHMDNHDVKLTTAQEDHTILTWKNGCQMVPLQPTIWEDPFGDSPLELPPTVLVVVLALAPQDFATRYETKSRICHVLPNQWEYFVHPQKLDVLFLVHEDSNDWTIEQFVSCWGDNILQTPPENTTINRIWNNLDGTKLTTVEYHHVHHDGSFIRVFVARTAVEYPTYIQQDPTLLSKPITPKACEAPRNYIQATRWYTKELLNLGILSEYQYFLKLDTDIIFTESIPFYLLQDMANKNAVFGHTAEYHPKGSKTCAMGITQATRAFLDAWAQTEDSYNSTRLPPWNKTFCSIEPELKRDADQYYTNFIIGKVEFWQSPWVLEWSRFLNEYPEGFFTYRWTDQIFWHYTMGLFLQRFKDYVVDYTDLRCMPHPNCWYSSYNFVRYGPDAWHRCDSGGYFLHPKEFRFSNKRTPKRPAVPRKNVTQILFQSTYTGDCSKQK